MPLLHCEVFWAMVYGILSVETAKLPVQLMA